MKTLISLLILGVIIIPGGTTRLDHMFSLHIFGRYLHILELFYVIIILLWLLQLLTGKAKIVKSKLNLPLIIWYLYLTVSISIGVLNSNSFKYIASDFRALAYYSIYFVIISVIKSPKWGKTFCKILIFAMLIYSVQIISVFIFKNYFLANFMRGIQRIGFRTGTLSVITIPLLVALIYYSPAQFNKILYALVSVPLIFQWIVSQSRVVWVSVLLSLVTLPFTILWLERPKIPLLIKKVVSLFVLSFLVILVVRYTMFLFVGDSGVQYILSRFHTIRYISETGSFRIRSQDYNYAINMISKAPFLGGGLGAPFFTHTEGLEGLYVDNSYLTLLRKTGIVGLFLFFWVMSIFIRKLMYAAKNLNNIESPFSKALVVTLLSALPGFFVVTLLSSCLTHYRITFIFGAIMAIVEILGKSVEQNSEMFQTLWD